RLARDQRARHALVDRRGHDQVGIVLVVPPGQVRVRVAATAQRRGNVVRVPGVAVPVTCASSRRWKRIGYVLLWEIGGVPRVADPSASVWSAACKREGNSLPRRSARRRMPAAARADSPYLGGTGLVSTT